MLCVLSAQIAIQFANNYRFFLLRIQKKKSRS